MPKFLCTNNYNADSLDATYTMVEAATADSCAQNCAGNCNVGGVPQKCSSDNKTYAHYHCIKAFN